MFQHILYMYPSKKAGGQVSRKYTAERVKGMQGCEKLLHMLTV